MFGLVGLRRARYVDSPVLACVFDDKPQYATSIGTKQIRPFAPVLTDARYVRVTCQNWPWL